MTPELRTLLRVDGAAAAAAGLAALVASGPIAEALSVTPTSVLVVGSLLVVLGADALLVSRAPRFLTTFVLVREVALAVVLAVGLVDGLGAGDAVMGVLLADAAIFGAVELRWARGSRRATATAAS